MVGGITAAELDDMDIPALSWRWMDLRYAGTCKVCGARIGRGERGYWDAGARTVTCSALSCCEADGLTTQQRSGSPVSGQFVVGRSEHRVGSAAPAGVIVTRFNSGATVSRNARGRCEDAPCCGCCDY
jgi:hypothetical protein